MWAEADQTDGLRFIVRVLLMFLTLRSSILSTEVAGLNPRGMCVLSLSHKPRLQVEELQKPQRDIMMSLRCFPCYEP